MESVQVKCTNCKKVLLRRRSWVRENIKLKQNNYCSRSCAVTVNNTRYQKNPGKVKHCVYCNKKFVSRKYFCSLKCRQSSQIIG